MSTYKIGDKVVLRKDLKDGEIYGGVDWASDMEYMKGLPYVTINHVDYVGDYEVLGKDSINWYVSDDMISHKYQPSPTKKQRIEKLESDYKLLNEEHVKLLDTVIKLTEQVNELTNPTPAKTVEKPVVELTPNQKRKQIIDEAKEFVKKTESVKFELAYDIDLVNRVISVAPSKGYLSTKGTTTVKCLPKEVFNVHIGKAIALAKRYNMKDEFEKFSNAIQPTKKVEGMRVKHDKTGKIITLVAGRSGDTEKLLAAVYSGVSINSTIYDDSNAKY